MRKVILQIDVTLDGFIADSDGEQQWVKGDAVMNQDASDLLDTADTILLGRVAYQQFVSFWPFADISGSTIASKIAHQINHATKLVFSRTLDRVEWGTWDNARLVKDDIAGEIARLKAQPGKNLVLYAGAGIIATFTQLRLIDEYRLRVHPVVLGQGLPLFQRTAEQHNLKLLQAKSYPHGVVLLDYVSSD